MWWENISFPSTMICNHEYKNYLGTVEIKFSGNQAFDLFETSPKIDRSRHI